MKAKAEHPEAEFVVHPECIQDLLEEADYIGSTSGIINYISQSECKEFIIGTENGVIYELKQKNPDKKFYPLNDHQICADMKLMTLEKIIDVLENGTNEVNVTEELRREAMKPLERMLELSR
jgi:quinolinate synthase